MKKIFTELVKTSSVLNFFYSCHEKNIDFSEDQNTINLLTKILQYG